MQPLPSFESFFMVFHKSIPAIKIIFKRGGGGGAWLDSSGLKSRGKKEMPAPFFMFIFPKALCLSHQFFFFNSS